MYVCVNINFVSCEDILPYMVKNGLLFWVCIMVQLYNVPMYSVVAMEIVIWGGLCIDVHYSCSSCTN